MDFQLFCGVDSAKDKYDLATLSSLDSAIAHSQFPNHADGIAAFLADFQTTYALPPEQVLFCVENTGLYSQRLVYALHEAGYAVWVEDAYQLARSQGRTRAKTDTLDAQRIAQYACRFTDRARLFQPESDTLLRLRSLVAQRKRLSKAGQLLEVPLNEELHASTIDLTDQHHQTRQAIDNLRKQLKALDQAIDLLIEQDHKMAHQQEIIRSVPGFGPVTTRLLLIVTNGFTRYTNPRQLASYAGVAPFPKQSGKSLQLKPKTSSMANTEFKTALTMAAQSLIARDNPFGKFYRIKRAEGKKHLVALNAVRNKLIHTVCACLRDDVMYEKNMHLSLQKP